MSMYVTCNTFWMPRAPHSIANWIEQFSRISSEPDIQLSIKPQKVNLDSDQIAFLNQQPKESIESQPARSIYSINM